MTICIPQRAVPEDLLNFLHETHPINLVMRCAVLVSEISDLVTLWFHGICPVVTAAPKNREFFKKVICVQVGGKHLFVCAGNK